MRTKDALNELDFHFDIIVLPNFQIKKRSYNQGIILWDSHENKCARLELK